jgi:hypothetical protein
MGNWRLPRGKYKDPDDAFQRGVNLREEADKANARKQADARHTEKGP